MKGLSQWAAVLILLGLSGPGYASVPFLFPAVSTKAEALRSRDVVWISRSALKKIQAHYDSELFSWVEVYYAWRQLAEGNPVTIGGVTFGTNDVTIEEWPIGESMKEKLLKVVSHSPCDVYIPREIISRFPLKLEKDFSVTIMGHPVSEFKHIIDLALGIAVKMGTWEMNFPSPRHGGTVSIVVGDE